MRAAWMIGLGVLTLLLCRAIGRAIHWTEMWAADRMTLTAEAALLLLFAALGFGLLIAGGRWLLLVAWRKPTHIEFATDAITLRLGPFGTHVLDCKRMRFEVETPADEDFPLPDDEPFLPRVQHPDFAGNLTDWITRFTGATPAELDAAYRPLMKGNSPA